MLDASTDCIKVVDPDGALVYMNANGLCAMEIDDFAVVRGREWASLWPPETAGMVRDAVARAGRGETVRLDAACPTAKGAPRWWEVSLAPIRDDGGAVTGVVSISRDVSDRRRAETALRSSEEHLRVAQTAGGVATWEWDIATGTVAWSSAMNMLLGLGPDHGEPTFEAFLERVHPDDVAALHEGVREAIAGAPYAVEFRIVRPDGSVRWLAGRAEVSRDAAGAPLRMIGVNYDVTERREAVEALAGLNADLEARVAQSAAKLVQLEKMESIGRLTGGIAHDFNNVLAVVMANLEVLQRLARGNDRMRTLAENAMKGAERGAALTERLLAFARKQDLHPQAVALPQLIDGMADLLRRSLGPRVRLTTGFAPGLPPVLVDANQLELAILNLAVNARDAMPSGGSLRITADLAEPASDPARVRLRIADDGIGMDAETLRHAMEPFYTTKVVGRGTGLGLAIVHGLAVQSGGELRLLSEPGRGTTAEILLPAAAPAASVAAAPGMRMPDAPASGGLRIMLVDDDPAVLEGSAGLISDLGHAVVPVASGEEALRLLGSGCPVDVLITDHAMPGMTGLDLLRRLRRERPDIPVILASGLAGAEACADATVLRLSKPYRRSTLEGLLADLRPGLSRLAG